MKALISMLLLSFTLICPIRNVYCEDNKKEVDEDDKILLGNVYVETENEAEDIIHDILKFLNKGNHNHALTLFEKLLDKEVDPKYLSESYNDHALQVPISVKLRQVINLFPKDKLETIVFKHNVNAKQHLAKYKETHDIIHLKNIVDYCFMSDEAPQSLLFVAESQIEKGLFSKAEELLLNLKNNYPDFNKNGKVDARLVFVSYLRGNNKQAEQLSSDLLKRHENVKFNYNGNEISPAELFDSWKADSKNWELNSYRFPDRPKSLSLADSVNVNSIKWLKTFPKLLRDDRRYAGHGKGGRGMVKPGVVGPMGGGMGKQQDDVKSRLPIGEPSVWKNKILFNTGQGIDVYDIETGDVLAKPIQPEEVVKMNAIGAMNMIPFSVRSSTVHNDTLYATLILEAKMASGGMGRFRGANLNFDLIAFDLKTNKIKWQFKNVNKGDATTEDFLRDAHANSTPVIHNGVLYIETVIPKLNNEIHVTAINAKTGKLIWDKFICVSLIGTNMAQRMPILLGKGADCTYGNFGGKTIFCNKVDIFVTTEYGAVAKLNAVDGKIAWLRKFPVKKYKGKEFRILEWMSANPQFLDGKLLCIPQDTRDVLLINPETGADENSVMIRNVKQRFHLGNIENKIYVYADKVMEIDAKTGDLKDSWGAFGELTGSPAMTKKCIYFVNNQKLNIASIAKKKIVGSIELPADLHKSNVFIKDGKVILVSRTGIAVLHNDSKIQQISAD